MTQKRFLFLIAGLALLNMLLVPAFVLAQDTPCPDNDPFCVNKIDIPGLIKAQPTAIATTIIRTILGFLGLLAVIVILVGGFQWMLAMGNEEKVEKAKELLWAGIIGIIIVISAFAISKWVITTIANIK